MTNQYQERVAELALQLDFALESTELVSNQLEFVRPETVWANSYGARDGGEHAEIPGAARVHLSDATCKTSPISRLHFKIKIDRTLI